MVIGLNHFKDFGYQLHGVPTPQDNLGEGEKPNEHSRNDARGVPDGLTALELSPDVDAALEQNQQLPLSSRCTHPLPLLRVLPVDKSSIWSRVNFASKKDRERISVEILRCRDAGLIEPAPEAA